MENAKVVDAMCFCNACLKEFSSRYENATQAMKFKASTGRVLQFSTLSYHEYGSTSIVMCDQTLDYRAPVKIL
jgi:hypothetical protein